MLRMIGYSVLVLVGLAAAAYFVRPLLQTKLNDAARAQLLTEAEPGMPAAAQRKFETLQDGVAHVRFADPGEGNAGVILLVHGFSTPSYVWRDYFEPLSKAGYVVVAPDLFGRGYSDRVAKPYDERLFLNQIDALVSVYGNGRPVHLVGYSMGGAIVARYAQKNPSKVETAALLAPAGMACGQGTGGWAKTPLIGDFLFRVLGPWLLETSLAPERTAGPDPEFWIRMLRKSAAYAGYEDALLSTLRNFPFLDSCDAMKVLKASGKRVLAVFAKQDTTIPIAQADVFASFPGHARIVRVSDRGHGVTYAAPAPIVDEILKLVSLEP